MSQPRLIECVPNFSEGRDMGVIKQITDAIEAVDGVRLLNVDPGRATNRTVVTFVGEPEPVCEAAFQAAKKAQELIDMRRHRGEHPRFGALDVCPLIPISGVSMDETVEYARTLGKHLGEELGIAVYLYEYAATSPARRNLSTVRSGEYEGLEAKLVRAEWKPDYGPTSFDPKFGATAVGARDFLIAFNVNLNTTSVKRANAVAFDIRERGRPLREGDPVTGKTVKDANGDTVYNPGSLKAVKAIGWFIEEYGIAQISINLTNLAVTPVHLAFEEACEKARLRGMRVTGSELVGLIPLRSILEAGRYFLAKQQRSTGVSDRELIKIAVSSLGLNDLAPFNPRERIIEYAIQDDSMGLLTGRSVRDFVEQTAAESPAPGGGSTAAAVGALGAALGTMVANLSAQKSGWQDRWQEFSDWAEKGKASYEQLLGLVDEDTNAYNSILGAHGLPKGTDSEKASRDTAIQTATKAAVDAPLRVMRTAIELMAVIRAMAELGNPNSASDAGVGALCACCAVRAAGLNVRINVGSLEDKAYANDATAECAGIEQEAQRLEAEILQMVARTM